MGNGDYMDLMSMYGDHSGNLMGGDLDGQMIFGAGHEDLEDLMSMYGDHTDMLMGGDLNDQMIFGAGNDEDLRFSFKKIGRGLKKAAKSKIGKEIIRQGKKAAIDYAKRRAGLGEED